MADYVAKALQLPINGVNKTFELKDAVARAATIGGTHYLGVTTTALTDGSEVTSITISGASVSVSNGDVVIYGNAEFVYASADSKWHEMGDLSSLGDLAYENSAVISGFTPEGEFDDFDVTPTVEEGAYVIADNSTDVGSVSAGTADSLTMSVPTNTETLQISWTAGTPTAVTLPTFTQQDIVTGITSVDQPTFSADPQSVTAEPAE